MDWEVADFPRVVEEVVALLERKAELVFGLKQLMVAMPDSEVYEILLRSCLAAKVSLFR